MKPFYKTTGLALCLVAMLYWLGVTDAFAQDNTTSDVQSAEVAGPNAEQIVGGRPADPGEYPWQVMVATSGGQMFCGGSLIHPEWVLTAAHCLEDGLAGKVILGAHRRTNTSEATRQVINVRRYLIHPSYNSNTLNNDIGLIELTSPATLNGSVSTVGYATAAEDALFAAGVTATVTGWGATQENGSLASVLMEVEMPIVSNATCRQSYGTDITNNMLCAGLAEGGKDSCQGDSGGPLVVPNTGGGFKLAGVVSWGNGCARRNYYGVYTRVANYTSWIEQYVDTTPVPTPTPTTPTPTPPTPTPPTPTPPTPTPPTPTPPTPTPTPDGPAIVKNGDFDLGGNGDWKERSKRGYDLILNNAPISTLSGSWLAWLAGDDSETSRLIQKVRLPSGPLYLNYSYFIDSGETKCGVDLGRVYLGKSRLIQYQLCTNNETNSWVQTTIDISKYAGKTLNLQFFAKTNRRNVSSFFIENVSITSTPLTRSVQLIEMPEGIEDDEADITEQLFLPFIAN